MPADATAQDPPQAREAAGASPGEGASGTGEATGKPRGRNGVATGSRRGRPRGSDGGGDGEKTSTPAAREPGEDFFEHLLRPDVAPFVRSVSLVRASTGEGGRALRDPAIVFAAPPTMDEVLDRLTEAGYYECAARGDGGAFLATQKDPALNITDAALEAHRARREREKQSTAETAPPAGESAADRLVGEHFTGMAEELRAERQAREADREKHEAKVEALNAAHATKMEELNSTHAEQLAAARTVGGADNTAMQGFAMAKEMFGGGSMDAQRADTIRDKAHADGYAQGLSTGKHEAFEQARDSADRGLERRAEELDQRAADTAAELDKRDAAVERREAKHEKLIAGANEGATERETELDKRQGQLEAYAKRLSVHTASCKTAAAKITAAREDLDAREADLAGREDQLTAIGDPRATAIAESAMEVDPDETFGDFADLFDNLAVADDVAGQALDESKFPPAPATPVVPVADPAAGEEVELNPPSPDELELALGPD